MIKLVTAPPPGDLLLREDAVLHHVLDLCLLQCTLLHRLRRWWNLSGAPEAAGVLTAMTTAASLDREEELAEKVRRGRAGKLWETG